MQVKHTRRRPSRSSSRHRRPRCSVPAAIDCLFHHPDAKSSFKIAQRIARRSGSRGDAKTTHLAASPKLSCSELEPGGVSVNGVSANKPSVRPFFTASAQGATTDSHMKPLSLPAIGRTIYNSLPSLPTVGRTIYDVTKPAALGIQNNENLGGRAALGSDDETDTDLRKWMTSWERRLIADMDPEEQKRSATVQLALQEASRKMKAHWQVRHSSTSEQRNTTETEDPEDPSCDSSSWSMVSSWSCTRSTSWSTASSDCSNLESSCSESSERSSSLWGDMSDRLRVEYTTTKLFDDFINAEAYQEC
ncbi:uncharacterized protein STEHIDRAFT_151907 [Stereum hirsutum FP-91666 SS1]|uniref:uncharacterized protein n=1 Tax=Stereum hirsutum (strain FP-91666) TaxID=721885 RepID=UPI000440A427|nr:uncharacterized protein STEHIDRAFT_151907 [Stereum hirsutum FP-91666 SS1]EIM92589.1 hypothetical protein STEHIDRAFT_151907 [Stereum hirsutum FP-91666 SS1]